MGICTKRRAPSLDLEKKSPGLTDAAVQGDARGEADLAFVRRVYGERAPKHRKVFIDAVRNFVAFHYQAEMLKRALAKHLAAGHLDGTFITSPHAGIGRYTMTDNLATLLMSDALGGKLEGFQKLFSQKMEEVIKLAGALAYVVDHVLGHLMLAQRRQDVKTEDGTVRVDPFIERARLAVQAKRRGGAA